MLTYIAICFVAVGCLHLPSGVCHGFLAKAMVLGFCQTSAGKCMHHPTEKELAIVSRTLHNGIVYQQFNKITGFQLYKLTKTEQLTVNHSLRMWSKFQYQSVVNNLIAFV